MRQFSSTVKAKKWVSMILHFMRCAKSLQCAQLRFNPGREPASLTPPEVAGGLCTTSATIIKRKTLMVFPMVCDYRPFQPAVLDNNPPSLGRGSYKLSVCQASRSEVSFPALTTKLSILCLRSIHLANPWQKTPSILGHEGGWCWGQGSICSPLLRG